MASLKDKLKSKIKSKVQTEVLQSFDQTSLNVTLIQGKSQLNQLKVCSAWIVKTASKLPKFKCKWYNRTDNNYQEIVGIQDEFYQPSILDVDSIVEVTCIPQIPGVNYQGMPFLLKSKPITLSPDTETEANKMLGSGKVKLIVSIKSAKIKGIAVAPGNEGMVQIQHQKLTLSQVKFGQINDQILKIIYIDDIFPQITLNKRISREIGLKINEEESCVLQFKSHQIRDSFYLFFQLLHAKRAYETLKKQQVIKQPQQTCQSLSKEPTQQCIKQQQFQSPLIQQSKQEHQEEIKQAKLQPITISKQQIQQPAQNIAQQAKTPKILQTRQTKIDESKKIQEKASFKQNTSDLLQSVKLKQEIKRLQQQNLKLAKQCEKQKNKVIDLELRNQQFNERLNNASINYFTLEKQLHSKEQVIVNLKSDLDKIKDIQSSKLQEIIYYKNQIKLLIQQTSKLKQSNASLMANCQEYKSQVSMYKQKYVNDKSPYSYKQLIQELNGSKQAHKQLKLKYEFQVQQKQKAQQNLKDSRNLIEQIESQKRHIQKKYESLTSELSSSFSPSLASRYSERFSEKSPQNSLAGSFVLEDIPNLQKTQSLSKKLTCQHDYREKEILDLKRQLKDYVDENNHLRSIIQKEKKSTSRAHLKVELLDAKKIVSRLSETIAEKQMTISQLKEINKELNRKNQQSEQAIAVLKVSKS